MLMTNDKEEMKAGKGIRKCWEMDVAISIRWLRKSSLRK